MTAKTPDLDLSTLPLDKIYIDGEWAEPAGDTFIDVVSPDTEEVVARVAEASRDDVDRATAAARSAFDKGPWPRLTLAERMDHVRRFSAAVQARSDEISLCWSMQVGVPRTLAAMLTPMMVNTIDPYLELAAEMELVEQRPTPMAGAGLVALEPVGVVAAIAPWNVPVNTMLHKVGPALIAGCTVIMKPSPETPLEAYIMAQCAHEVGFPAGVINMFCADRDVSDYLVQSRQVDKVSFTGSVAAGKRIASVCADRIARVSLELGGKSAAIILDDYDLDAAAQQLVMGIAGLSGQNCALLSRAFVSRARHDELVAKLKAGAESLVIGNSFDETTQLGPLVAERQRDRFEALIAVGVAEGANLVTGGGRPAHLDRGYFVEPVIFANVSNDMRIAREEIFGPALCVIPYDDLDHALAMANDSDFGLAGAVFTDNLESAYQVARRLRTGTVSQNGGLADFALGFGGFKQSGIGREGGAAGLRGYFESKTILINGVPEAL
ncbi:MAG: aldehyde dehydrogenase (NAD+) [Halieaceae bacterium]|jgi:aldehyde dehydrogenase (NAD+)